MTCKKLLTSELDAVFSVKIYAVLNGYVLIIVQNPGKSMVSQSFFHLSDPRIQENQRPGSGQG